MKPLSSDFSLFRMPYHLHQEYPLYFLKVIFYQNLHHESPILRSVEKSSQKLRKSPYLMEQQQLLEEFLVNEGLVVLLIALSFLLIENVNCVESPLEGIPLFLFLLQELLLLFFFFSLHPLILESSPPLVRKIFYK